MFDVR